MADSVFVVETPDGFDADAVFVEGRDQVVIAIRITPVFGQLELGLVATVVDEANARGMALLRETPFREEYLLCVFEAFGDSEDDLLAED